MTWEDVRREASKYLPFVEQKLVSLVEEMQGIAAATDTKILDLVALNVRTEITFGLFTSGKVSQTEHDGCTSLALQNVGGQQSSFLAQNWDWQAEQSANISLCRVSQPRTNKPVFVMCTEGGVIGKIGFNSSGVGVCMNAIRARGVNYQGAPVHVAMRTALESTTCIAAVESLKTLGTAGSAHLLVADRDTARGLECTAHGVLELPLDERGTIVHTNHLILEHAGVDEPPWLDDSRPRLSRMQSLLNERRHASEMHLDFDQIQAMFEDEDGFPFSINRSQQGTSTIQTLFNVVMDLRSRKARFTFGRANEAGLRKEIAV